MYTYELTEQERQLCDSLNIDYEIVKELRTINASTLKPFHDWLSYEHQRMELGPIDLDGLVFAENYSKAFETVFALKEKFKLKDYSIFLLEKNYGNKGRPDLLTILKTTDKYAILNQIQTNGINYGIDTDSLITIIRGFDEKYSLELIGASMDWCEFIVNNPNTDWEKLANETYAVCPDVVSQGTGSIEALIYELKKDKRLYFWWD